MHGHAHALLYLKANCPPLLITDRPETRHPSRPRCVTAPVSPGFDFAQFGLYVADVKKWLENKNPPHWNLNTEAVSRVQEWFSR